MFVLWIAVAGIAIGFETAGNPKLNDVGVTQQVTSQQPGGNFEGKEVRFGPVASGLFAGSTTGTSTGAVNSMHDSFTPAGGGIVLLNIMFGEVSPGGVGSGLYGILIFALLSVFIAGLMVGRTPEYLGKKVESFEMKMAMVVILVLGLSVLGFTAIATVTTAGLAGPLNAGPHGFSEILYAFTSQTANNGSAFAGLTGNTPFYNVLGALAMLIGRFGMIIPVLAVAGSMAAKRSVAPSMGTFPTTGGLWSALLIGVLVIVGALTYFPALALGPIVEQLLQAAGQTF